MTAAVAEPRMRIVPTFEDRALVCAKCGRHLSKRRVACALPTGAVWTQVKCPECNRWRWFDLADGRMVDAPGG
jgi:hypothetical protein